MDGWMEGRKGCGKLTRRAFAVATNDDAFQSCGRGERGEQAGVAFTDGEARGDGF